MVKALSYIILLMLNSCKKKLLYCQQISLTENFAVRKNSEIITVSRNIILQELIPELFHSFFLLGLYNFVGFLFLFHQKILHLQTSKEVENNQYHDRNRTSPKLFFLQWHLNDQPQIYKVSHKKVNHYKYENIKNHQFL